MDTPCGWPCPAEAFLTLPCEPDGSQKLPAGALGCSVVWLVDGAKLCLLWPDAAGRSREKGHTMSEGCLWVLHGASPWGP